MIIAFAPHEVESIDQIYFNDELVSQGTTPVSKYSGKLDVIIKNGDQTSADSTIVSRISEWTSNHKLLGIAYVYVRLEYDDEIFSSGVPNVTAVIRGKNDIYDPRTDTSGYTNNHALCLANYLQSDFGVRATDDEVDWDSFAAAADVSDELFAGKGRLEVSDFNDSVFLGIGLGKLQKLKRVIRLTAWSAPPLQSLTTLTAWPMPVLQPLSTRRVCGQLQQGVTPRLMPVTILMNLI